MNTHQMNDQQTGPEDVILEEAIAWLICLRSTAPDPNDPYRDPTVRNGAFFEWLRRSAAHLRVFMELMELSRRARRLDPDAFGDIRRLAEIESLTEATVALPEGPAPVTKAVPPTRARPNRRRVTIGIALAAGCAAAAGVAWVLHFLASSPTVDATKPEIYTTQFGVHQERKLRDGSVIELNTDSQVEVRFSTRARDVRLIRGEAYFEVTHNPEEPFTVTSDEAAVRVVGTKFDVRRRHHSTEVVVVSGRVHAAVIPTGGQASAQGTSGQPVNSGAASDYAAVLSDGEMATVSSGKVTRVADGNVQDALSWRQNQLVFRHARLADVVDEFNRYNQVQMRVEGAAAQDMRISGTFDIGGYRDILAFAQEQNSLLVVKEGRDWVIRSRP